MIILNPNRRKQILIPKRESPVIHNPKEYPSWRQKVLIPRCHQENSNKDPSLRQKELIPGCQLKQRGIPNSDPPWKWKFPEITSWGFLFALAGTQELIPFGANSDLCWNFPDGTLELIPFGANSDIPWDWGFTEIPSRGFLFDFTRWGLLCLSIRWELHIYLLRFYYAYPLLGNYINHQKEKISYIPLDSFIDYVYNTDLNTTLRVGWKTLPNLNLKLKFQTQTWISKPKYSPSSWVIRYSGKLTPRVKLMKPYCHVAAQSIWAVAWYFIPWRPF